MVLILLNWIKIEFELQFDYNQDNDVANTCDLQIVLGLKYSNFTTRQMQGKKY